MSSFVGLTTILIASSINVNSEPYNALNGSSPSLRFEFISFTVW